MKRVAILNGFTFHYEMFGYIIHYCLKRNYEVDIFTNNTFSSDWFNVYESLFHKYEKLNFISRNEEKKNELVTLFVNKPPYDIVYVPTHWEQHFPFEQCGIDIRHKTVVIDHSADISLHSVTFENHIAVRPFSYNERKWALPCFPIFTVAEKQLCIPTNIDVAIIGGKAINRNVLERLRCSKPFTIHYITRFPDKTVTGYSNIKIYEFVSTSEMLNIVSRCSYVVTDIQNDTKHGTGYSMSGAIPLAFSTLCRLVISLNNNTFYQFKTAIEFDLSGDEPIVLPDTLGYSMLDEIAKERAQLMDMLDEHMRPFE